MPLPLAPLGEERKIIKIMLDEKTKRHLENLGITVSSMLVPLSQSGGSVILKVKEGRLALNREVAMRIFVA